MKKIIWLLLPVLLLASRSAAAQSGACPPNSYLEGTPSETWQDDTAVCAYNFLAVFLHDDNLGDAYPCEQQVGITIGNTGVNESVIYVPPSTQFYGQTARVRFELFFFWVLAPWRDLVPPGPEYDDLPIRIEYYNHLGNLESYSDHMLGHYTKVYTWWDDTVLYNVNHYYVVYIIDQQLFTSDGADGFFKVYLRMETGLGPPNLNRWFISSWRAGSVDDNMPELCEIPNASLPGPTPQPTPTGTLPATWTPAASTPTPIQTPGATAPGTTPVPTWTLTPWVYPTVEAETTPTPWPQLAIPTVVWSTPNVPIPPTVAGGGGVQVTPNTASIGDLVDGIDLIVTRWYTSTTFGLGLGEVLPIQQAYTSGITTSYIISGAVVPTRTIIGAAPGTVGGVLTGIPSYISEAVGYWKMLQQLTPNMWPLLSGIMIFFFVIIFILLLRFGIHAAIALIEWLRRIIELIPGM